MNPHLHLQPSKGRAKRPPRPIRRPRPGLSSVVDSTESVWSRQTSQARGNEFDRYAGGAPLRKNAI